MSKPSALSALLPRTRIGLLTALFMHPDRWWYLSELARELETRASSLQRELAALSDADILRRRQDGNRIYYRANDECPLFPELQGLIAKTAGLVDVLRQALEPLGDRIEIAFVYGSMARGDALATSDVDLLVVGDVGLKQLATPLQHVAARLGRPVNPTIYPPDEFAAQRSAGNRFLATVLADEKLFVIGTSHDLGAAPAPEASPEDPDRPGRDRAASRGD